jgi:CRP-like cAMP-binding protein
MQVYYIIIQADSLLPAQQKVWGKRFMREYIEDLAHTSLFSGMSPDQIAALLGCIHAKRVEYKKDDVVIEEGNAVCHFGVMLSGRARAVKWDASGRLIIITLLQKGSEIGVILAASLAHESPVTVQVQADAAVLQIPFDKALQRCSKACPWHDRLLRNFIGVVAEKGLVLHERIDCLLKPTVREKVLAYLKRVSQERQSRTFAIPLNRNAMAEYLNVERSALSRELSNMKKDGLIDYHTNVFQLL